jgi:hypothetical protein
MYSTCSRRRGIAETQIDLAAASAQALEAFRSAPDYIAGEKLPATPEAGLLTGETGILVVAWSLSPSDDLDEALLARVRQNVDNTVDELMWGSPGTLLVARAMLEWTGREQWRGACGETAEALWARRDAEGFWTQDLYGVAACRLGPVHGLVGNVLALLDCVDRDPARAPSGGHLRASRAYCRRRRRARKLADARRATTSSSTTARSACSGARELRGSSPPPPRTSTKSFSPQERSSPGEPVRPV